MPHHPLNRSLQLQPTCWKVPTPELSFLHRIIHQRKLTWSRYKLDISNTSGLTTNVSLQENNLSAVFSLAGSELEDFMEEDNHPVSSSDPMLSSPAPSTLSSSPSSLYSSDTENLSPQSIDHLIVWWWWSIFDRFLPFTQNVQIPIK